MELRKISGLIAGIGVLATALLSGCGSSNTTTIPSTTSIFDAHTVAFKNNSTLKTMGYNGFGQLGQGNLNTITRPVVVSGLGPVNGASAGADHTLAFSFSNLSSVYAWGSNYHGQIGSSIAVSGTGAYSSIPVRIPLHGAVAGGFDGKPAGTVTSVSAGAFHSLAVMDGIVYSWGYDGYGQLGDRLGQTTFADNATPAQVILTSQSNVPLKNIVQVSAGGAFSLALTANLPGDPIFQGRVYAWGDNTYGEIGTNPLNVGNVTTSAPQFVFGPDGIPLYNITQVVAGGSTSYAVDSGDTTVTPARLPGVWAWGYNGMGQIGNSTVPISTTAANMTPVKVDLTLPSGTTIKMVAAGLSHALVLDSGGHVWAWGFDEYGQLGTSTTSTTNSSTPQQVLAPAGSTGLLSNVIYIAAFGNTSLALVRDPNTGVETWYGWGDNGYGQLGQPVSNSTLSKFFVPTLVPGI